MLDIEAERQRLQRELEELLAELERTRALLANEQFVTRAPAHVVERHRAKLADAEERMRLIRTRLDELA
jgi:valyl-tRNA synthetase